MKFKLLTDTEIAKFNGNFSFKAQKPVFYPAYKLGDNCIQIFHLGRYIVGAVKRNFRTYIRRYTSPNENLNMVIPILMHFLTFTHWNQLFSAKNIGCVNDVYSLHWPITSAVAHDVGLPTVYHRIYCRKFPTLSNQTSRYILRCIRMCISRIKFMLSWVEHENSYSAKLSMKRV